MAPTSRWVPLPPPHRITSSNGPCTPSGRPFTGSRRSFTPSSTKPSHGTTRRSKATAGAAAEIVARTASTAPAAPPEDADTLPPGRPVIRNRLVARWWRASQRDRPSRHGLLAGGRGEPAFRQSVPQACRRPSGRSGSAPHDGQRRGPPRRRSRRGRSNRERPTGRRCTASRDGRAGRQRCCGHPGTGNQRVDRTSSVDMATPARSTTGPIAPSRHNPGSPPVAPCGCVLAWSSPPTRVYARAALRVLLTSESKRRLALSKKCLSQLLHRDRPVQAP
jgi:hypothetical protein